MGRVRRPFERPEGKLNARLLVIASEGKETEKIYFEALAKHYESKNVHVLFLTREDDGSDPDRGLAQLDDFKQRYNLDEDDELWMVIDRDPQAWEEQMIREVARRCQQHPNYYLAVSNPAFELWLLLHFVDCAMLPLSDQQSLLENKKVSRNKSLLDERVSEQVNGYNKSRYNPQPFVTKVNQAIAHANKLDQNPDDRWPMGLGTRVHLIAERIVANKRHTTNG